MKLNSVLLFTYTGKSVDITALVEDVVLYEDFTKSSISGRIVILDDGNLPEAIPMIGKEMIGITYSAKPVTPDDTGDLEANVILFDVLSLMDLSDTNQETKSYSMELASPVNVFNSTKVLQKRYKGSTSAIITDILINELNMDPKTIEIEGTADYLEVVCPSVTPLQMINWLANNIVDVKNSSLYFFQTNKKFKLKSLDAISEEAATATVTYGEKEAGIVPKASRILNYTGTRRYDLLPNLNNGYYANTIWHHDIRDKELKYAEFIYPGSVSYRDKYLPPTKIVLQVLKDMPTVSKRMHKKQTLNNDVMMVELFGNTTMEVGNKIDVQFPSTLSVRSKSMDPMTSGWYMVSKIKHVITQTDYHMVLELCRND